MLGVPPPLSRSDATGLRCSLGDSSVKLSRGTAHAAKVEENCLPVVWLQPSQDDDKRSALASRRTLRKPRQLVLQA